MTSEILASNVPADPFLRAISALPPLPKFVNYDDDYDEKTRLIKVDDTTETLTLHISGSIKKINFLRYNLRVRQLLRVQLIFSLQEEAPNSVLMRFYNFSKLTSEDIELAATVEPIKFRQLWPAYVAKYSQYELMALRSLLHFLCSVQFMSWSSIYSEFVSKALFFKTTSAYAGVHNGDAFLTIEEEAKLVRWFDEASIKAKDLPLKEIEDACLLASSYQFGMRPKQLGIIRMRNCTIRTSAEDGSSIVHLTFRIIKQRDPALALIPLMRRVKREWAPLFVRLTELKNSKGPDEFLFGYKSAVALSVGLSDSLEKILPQRDERRTANDLRHSMAQRLVDTGCSQEELAAAMGHTCLTTGLVYFRQSANQAEIINKALGLSGIYQMVISIAEKRFISADDLARLKGDQQIAGAPHGIPIAGIGGCKTGQSMCPYNPVTSCYGCNKFMPIQDINLHQMVLTEVRGVVNQFVNSSRDDANSPAFMQLRTVLFEIEKVIRGLEEPFDE